MVDLAEPPEGRGAHFAFLEFTDPSKMEAWEKAETTIGLDPRYEITRATLEAATTDTKGEGWDAFGVLGKLPPRDYTPAELKTYLNAKRKAATAQRATCRDFGDKLRDGEIVAFGSPDPEGATGRSQLDADLWDTLRARTRRAWHASRFSGGGYTFHNVMFYREKHAVFPLGGLSLTDAYGSYVENDEKWRRMMAECELWHPNYAALLNEEEPGYSMVKVPRLATGVAEHPSAMVVPAAFERRPTVRDECWQVLRRSWGWGEDPGETPDFIPDEVIRVHDRQRECEAQFIGDLRSGNLFARGIREYPAQRSDLEPENIGPGWWVRNDLLVGFTANALFQFLDDRPVPVLLFSDVRVYSGRHGEDEGKLTEEQPYKTRVSVVVEPASSDKVLDKGVKRTIAAETKCGQWLKLLAAAGPPKKTSKEYWNDAQRRYGKALSKNAYLRSRAKACEINSAWGDPGRKPNKNNH